jgi:hypothetical protein
MMNSVSSDFALSAYLIENEEEPHDDDILLCVTSVSMILVATGIILFCFFFV